MLTKKLDALEEFRIQREQLMARFEEQESKIEAQKEEYEGRIYDLEKRHVQVHAHFCNNLHDAQVLDFVTIFVIL